MVFDTCISQFVCFQCQICQPRTLGLVSENPEPRGCKKRTKVESLVEDLFAAAEKLADLAL